MSRQIGPIGTASCAIAGSGAIAYTVVAHGLAAWDVAAGLIAFPIVSSLLHATVASAYDRLAMHRVSSRTTRTWVVSVAVLAIGIGLTFVIPIDGGAIFLFFGASLLIVAARGDAGCEVLAVVNAISGHRDRTGCVAFAPVDSLADGADRWTRYRPRCRRSRRLRAQVSALSIGHRHDRGSAQEWIIAAIARGQTKAG